jgi:hypothetical protein
MQICSGNYKIRGWPTSIEGRFRITLKDAVRVTGDKQGALPPIPLLEKDTVNHHGCHGSVEGSGLLMISPSFKIATQNYQTVP